MSQRGGHAFSQTTTFRIPSHGQRTTAAPSPYASPPQPQPAMLVGKQQAVSETKRCHTAHGIPMREKACKSSAEQRAFPASGMRPGYPLTTSSQQFAGDASQCNEARKRNERHRIEKEESTALLRQ